MKKKLLKTYVSDIEALITKTIADELGVSISEVISAALYRPTEYKEMREKTEAKVKDAVIKAMS